MDGKIKESLVDVVTRSFWSGYKARGNVNFLKGFFIGVVTVFAAMLVSQFI